MTNEPKQSKAPVEKDTANPPLPTQKMTGAPLSATGRTDSDAPRPLPGSFGRYEVTKRIGKGAFAEVYYARDEQLHRDVAIKVPRQTDQETFREEARLVARLRHPSIVSVYDFGVEESGDCYLVTELLTGSTLRDRLSHGALSLPEILAIGVQCAEALHYAHKQGIVHRDIKPENILLDENGVVRVSDFGLAVDESQQVAQCGLVSGTPNYMAPEQTKGAAYEIDGRTDIWSLGAVLYEMIAGRRPFRGRTVSELFEEIQSRNPKPLRMIDEALPPDVERIVLKCLEKEPTNRYSCAADLAADLRDCGQPVSVIAPAAQLSPAEAKTRATAAWFWIAALVGSLVLVTFLVAYIATRPAAQQPGLAQNKPGDESDVIKQNPIPPQTNGELTLEVMIWNKLDTTRQGLSITRPGVLPLRSGEEVTIRLNSSSGGYHYAVWVGSDSGITPLYPWPIGDWDLSEPARPRNHVEIPVGTVNPTPATETVLVMWRPTPLPEQVDLSELLDAFPQPNLLRGRGQPLTRGITFGIQSGPNESDQARRFLRQTLDTHFDTFQAVSFTSGDTDASALVQ